MQRRQLEHFVAVAESGSFTRAAATLHIAQPSLSHSIAVLEREVGAPLFERLGRGVRMTPAGEALFDPARRTLRSFDVALSAVRGAADPGFGRLSVITNTLWAIEPLVGINGPFRRRYPGVRFTVSDPGSRSNVFDAVRNGDVDFGLMDGVAPSGALASQWLAEHELVAVTPPGVELDDGPVGIRDVSALGIICTGRGTALRTLLDQQLELAGEPPEVAVETAHLASVVPLVLAGAGAALLPERLAGEARAHGARTWPLAPPIKASVYLVWRPDHLTAVGRDFLATATVGAEA